MLTEFLGPARSICPVCLKPLLGQYLRDRKGNVYLDRVCPEHGETREIVWEGDLDWLAWAEGDSIDAESFGSQEVMRDSHLSSNDLCPRGCETCTLHATRPCCVLLEVTRRCNLGCPVCFAGTDASTAASGDPSLETIGRWYDRVYEQAGFANLQFSGGEPTVRDDLPDIIRMGRDKGYTFFQINTNGLRLAHDRAYLRELKDAGASCVFLQFDGVDDDVYRIMRGRPLLSEKMAAIDACAEERMPVVLVPTVARGINDGQLGDIVRFALERAPFVRGVHIQPVARFGRFSPEAAGHITIPGVLAELERQTDGMVKRSHFRGGEAESVYCSFSASYRIDGGKLVHLPSAKPLCCGAMDDPDAVFRARRANSLRWGTDLDLLDTAPEPGSLDAFLVESRRNAFSITGMEFMDAETLDLERLERCYVFIADDEGKLFPFCAYNLTARDGRPLYRR